MNKRLAITLFLAVILFLGTVLTIFWAKGYRPSLKEKTIKGTGLLVANSHPKGASVYLNGKLTTATDDTLHLPPGEYQIKIVKDGFVSWEKTLQLESELVTQTNARLFPSVPDLTALTLTGAINPTPSPNGQKIVYAVSSASASLKNGLWVSNLNDLPLNFGSNHLQIAQNTSNIDFAQAEIAWSPNSQQILVSLPQGNHFLLPSDSFTKPSAIKDISATLPLVLDEWQQELAINNQKRLEKLPLFMQQVATTSAQQVYFSPDETKIVYLATEELTIPKDLLPSLPASSTQPEERLLQPGKVYVYDLKEDKNFLIKEMESPQDSEETSLSDIQKTLFSLTKQYSPLYTFLPQWLPTSRHLIFTEDNKINIIEYDGENLTTVYIGDFKDDFVYPWPSGNKLIILTSLNSPIPNLYSINLR